MNLMKMNPRQTLKKYIKDTRKSFKKKGMNLKMNNLIKIQFYKILIIITKLEVSIPIVININLMVIYKKIT